ncbi:MAG TPA: hypothetical protein VH120_17460 [Gemmataceae bacterium]|jgi:hypothetical protein|nr:hypothetical protein [Gemmataceae bacterium]
MSGLFEFGAVLAFLAGILATWGYAKTKKPGLALVAGALFLLAGVMVWRSFVPAPEHVPPGLR